VEALSDKDLAPHSEAIEADLAVTADSSRLNPVGLKLAQGAERLGLPCRQALRMAAAGDGRTAGQRQAMSKTYIPRALTAGCRLLAETRVLRLARAAGRWVCRARRNGASLDIEAEQVFLACGAVQTPLLLRRSGLAGRAGATLALHPTVKLVAEFPEEVNGPEIGVPAQQVKPAGMRWGLGCSLSSPSNLALALLDLPEVLARLAADWRRMAVYYAMVPGTGRGEIRPLPGCRDPLVRYQASPEDLASLGEAMRRLAGLLFAAGARKVYPSAGGLGPWNSAAEAERGASALSAAQARLMTIHLMGSCPMGEDRGLCVADSFGRVHGSPGLWLADASLFCGPLGVNPQGTVMALSRRNALMSLGGS
jgi:choline dehydrogenase-like flavoprotein